jgi:hypothetical protein
MILSKSARAEFPVILKTCFFSMGRKDKRGIYEKVEI